MYLYGLLVMNQPGTAMKFRVRSIMVYVRIGVSNAGYNLLVYTNLNAWYNKNIMYIQTSMNIEFLLAMFTNATWCTEMSSEIVCLLLLVTISLFDQCVFL